MSSTEPRRKRIKSTCPALPIENPTITTPRLIIRPLHHSDLPAYHKIRTSPAVMRYSRLQRPDVDVAFTKTKLDPSLPPQNRAEGTLTYLLGVEERSNPGVLIGDMGCHDANPGTEEIGYMFLDDFWGRGYATEALKAYLDHYWSLDRKEYVRIISEGDDGEKRSDWEDEEEAEVLRATTAAENVGSKNVLKKCGFKETRRFLHENRVWRVDLVLERPQAT